MNCKHNNCTIFEHVTGTHEYYFEDGSYTGSNVPEHSVTDRLEVRCDDCGMVRTYRKGHLPRWLARRWTIIRAGTEMADYDDGEIVQATHCDKCGREASEYDGAHLCQYCQRYVCGPCWIPGDDVTGDCCPLCGTYEYLRGG